MTVPCTICGKEFKKKRIRVLKHAHHFCSRVHFTSWMKMNAPSGEDHPEWKGGSTIEKRRQWGKNSYKRRRARYPEALRKKGREAMREWRAKHPSGRVRSFKDCHNPKYMREHMKRFRACHPESGIFYQTVKRMLRLTLRRKTSKTMKYIGCTPGFLRNHLESLFQPGMTWENHGEWHVDHTVPLSWFPFDEDSSLLYVASHWTNLRPLWAKENKSKGNKYAA